mmetsp:Transcript_28876/g.96069  ORF Transcript_28876/g.96069 Transcript_28876/m.96069 type:complete len:224 (+) Transcript_28876:272-943(+)
MHWVMYLSSPKFAGAAQEWPRWDHSSMAAKEKTSNVARVTHENFSNSVESLECTVDHIPHRAVHHEHFLEDLRGKGPPQPMRNENCVWIRLDREGIIPPLTLCNDLLPSMHEKLRVAGGVVHRLDDGCTSEFYGVHVVYCHVVVGSEDGEMVASEDAGALLVLGLHESALVSVGPDHREAEKRWEAFDGQAVTPGTKGLAAPRLILVIGMESWHTAAPALRPK